MIRALLFSVVMLGLAAAPAGAQAVTSAFTGFSGKSDLPVQIEADRLEVRETDQAAVFSGNVFVSQGNSTLRARKLTVFYDNKDSASAASAAPQSARNLRRLEADGSVVVTSRDQKATGERGIFDMPSNTVTMLGNVVLTQGPNVLKGDKLVVDLTTQKSRIESSNSGGRVQGVFSPSRPPAQ